LLSLAVVSHGSCGKCFEALSNCPEAEGGD
jgi:hypothetical protein